MKRVIGYVVLAVVLFFGYITVDWYRFATSGEISKTEGVFGNKKLEIWIDVNARMPSPARLWACRVLLERQTATMGREGAVPYSCQDGFGVDDGLTMSDRMIERYSAQAGQTAKTRGATEAQQVQVVSCVKAAMEANLSPETIAAMNGGATQEAILALNKAAQEASKTCLAAVK